MHLLIIEDEIANVDLLVATIGKKLKPFRFSVASNRESAIALLQDGWYDIAFCDLRIPPSDADNIPDVVHGEAVIQEIRERHMGMPIIVLSGYLTIDHREEFQIAGHQRDCFGEGSNHPMIRVYDKVHLIHAIEAIVSDGLKLNRLESIEVIPYDEKPLSLKDFERRVLRLFCCKVGGSLLRASRVTGGLSSSNVFKITAEAIDGSVKANAYAKVGRWSSLRDELKRYNMHVSPILLPGDFATLYQWVDAGAGPYGGIFYQHAHIETINMYDTIHDHPNDVQKVIEELQRIEGHWTVAGANSEMTIADLESECIGEAAIDIRAVTSELCRPDFSDGSFACRKSIQHFDLHGMNILVHRSSHPPKPILIDFGRVSIGPACFDPISLELSLLFHPDANRLRGDWPSLDQIRRWPELSVYVSGCPIKEFVEHCRKWTIAAKRGNREAFACVYAFALRQLMFRDTDHEIAKAFLESAARWYTDDVEMSL